MPDGPASGANTNSCEPSAVAAKQNRLRGRLLTLIAGLELCEEGSEAFLEGLEADASYPNALSTGLRSGEDLNTVDGNLQRVGQQTTAGSVGLVIYRWGSNRYFENSFSNAKDCIPSGPRLDEDAK